jgi:ketosteroid isomerase-like protein
MSDQTEKEVIAVENTRTAATVSVDIPALAAIYDDALVYVHSTGKMDDKAAVLAQLEKMRHIVGLERGDLKVVAWEDCALMSGPIHYRFRRPDGSERPMSAFATQMFRRDGGAWRLISFQATPLNPP